MDRVRNSLSRREFLGALTVTTGAGLVGAAPPEARARSHRRDEQDPMG